MATRTVAFQGRGYGNKRAQLCIATIFAKELELEEVELDNLDFGYDVARDDTRLIFEEISIGQFTKHEIMTHALSAGTGGSEHTLVAESVPGDDTRELLTQVSLESPCAGVISFEDESAVAFYIDDSNPESKIYRLMNPELAHVLECDTLTGAVPSSLEYELYKLAHGGQLKLDMFIIISRPAEEPVLKKVKKDPDPEPVKVVVEPVDVVESTSKKRKGTTRSKTVKKKEKGKEESTKE